MRVSLAHRLRIHLTGWMGWLKFKVLSLTESRCYWWPLEEKEPDGAAADFGVNTRNMDPMDILHVNRKIDKAWLFKPLSDKATAHEQDQAKY